MTTFETLQKLENFYDLLKPAQEKCQESFVWISGIPHPFFNAVMHLKTKEKLNEKIEALIQASDNIPLSFWIHNQNESNHFTEILRKKGFQPIITCSLITKTVEAVTLPKHQIEKANLEIFHRILATSFHYDEIVKKGFAKLLENVDAENYIIYSDGQPVGTGTLVVNSKVGGIFNIATLPEFQKRGYGRAMMQFLMNRASTLGLETLVLLSSPVGEKLYLDLKFTKLMNVEIYAK